MDFERARKQDVEGRVYEALEKAKEAQARLNAAVTFVDPKSLLYSYRCSVYLFAAMRSAMSKKIFALLRLEDTAARLFLLPHLL